MNAITRGSLNEPPVEGPKPFVVVTSQRTGSTLLVRSLDSSPSVFCAGEIFYSGKGILHPEFQYPHKYLERGKFARLVNAIIQRNRVGSHVRVFYASAGRGSAAVGFKLMVSQVRALPMIMDALQQAGVIGFYLYRRDSFATALSYYKAKVSGLYHKDRSGQPVSQQTVTANEEEFRRLFETCRVDKDRVCGLQSVYGGRLLTYEDMVENWDDFIATIGSDIGLPDLRVQKALSRIGENGDSVCIANEDLLRKRISEGKR